MMLLSIVRRRYSRYCIFIVSFLLTLSILFIGKIITSEVIRSFMEKGREASFRVTDGAQNLVLMKGASCYIRFSHVYLKYDYDGYIIVSGRNDTENYQWEKIADLDLLPGTYTFTGLSIDTDDVIDLQLDYREGDSFVWFFQTNDDIHFTIEEEKKAEIYVRVHPYAEVNVVARPAIYKDD